MRGPGLGRARRTAHEGHKHEAGGVDDALEVGTAGGIRELVVPPIPVGGRARPGRAGLVRGRYEDHVLRRGASRVEERRSARGGRLCLEAGEIRKWEYYLALRYSLPLSPAFVSVLHEKRLRRKAPS